MCEAYSDIDLGNVANDIVLSIEDWDGANAFAVHKLERIRQGLISARHGLVSFQASKGVQPT